MYQITTSRGNFQDLSRFMAWKPLEKEQAPYANAMQSDILYENIKWKH